MDYFKNGVEVKPTFNLLNKAIMEVTDYNVPCEKAKMSLHTLKKLLDENVKDPEGSQFEISIWGVEIEIVEGFEEDKIVCETEARFVEELNNNKAVIKGLNRVR